MFLTKNIYPELLSYRRLIICLQNIFPNLSSIQMSEEHLTDSWAASIAHCTLEALGECLQSQDVVFLFVLKVKCLSEIIM